MPIKKWIKKSAVMCVCAAVLLNLSMPVFAYSWVNSGISSSDTFEVCVSKASCPDELMEINLGDQKISLSLAQNDCEPKPEKSAEELHKSEQLHTGQTEQIEDILPNVSVRYKMQENALKEDFILHGKEAANSFDLKYDVGDLHAEQMNEQNILLLDNDNRVKTIISAPYMTDAVGERSSAVSLKILNKSGSILSVQLTADSAWLQDCDRQYPVEVDPRYETLPTKPMQKGDNNEQVALLKNMLFEAGIGAGVPMHDVKRDMQNNTYSEITQRFVVAFQRAMDLAPTGIADANTLAALRAHLERKGILDTQEHIQEFLRRAELRAPRETSGFFGRIADLLDRINLTDLLVTSGTVAVVVGISAFCAPVTAAGIAFMLIGGSVIGGVAGGVSEYAQQRAVGTEIDWTRVVAKIAGGALKGTVSAIPGAGVGVAGMGMLAGGVGTAGTAENLLCSAKTTGLSRETVGDAILNGATQGIASIPAAALARGVVNIVKPQPKPLATATITPSQPASVSQTATLAPQQNTMNLLGPSESLPATGTGNLLGNRAPLQMDVMSKLGEKVAPSQLLQTEAAKKVGEVVTGGTALAGSGIIAAKGTQSSAERPSTSEISISKSPTSQTLHSSSDESSKPVISSEKDFVAPDIHESPESIPRSPSPGGSYHEELQQCEMLPLFLLEAAPVLPAPPGGVVIPFPAPAPAPAPMPLPPIPPLPIVIRPTLKPTTPIKPSDPRFIGPKQFQPIEMAQPRIGGSGKPLARNRYFDHKKEAKQAVQREARKGGGGGGGGDGTIHHPKAERGSHYHVKGSHDHFYYGRHVSVVAGDSLWSIAKRYGLDHKKLAKINGIKDPTKLQIGQVIKLGWEI